MATLLRRLPKAPASFKWIQNSTAAYSSDALKHNEAPIVDNSVILSDQEMQEREKLSTLVSLPKEKSLASISGVPEEHVKERRVRIFIPSKNSMQSGTNNIQSWRMEFDNRERWENPLMGWASTGDPLSNMNVDFNSKEEAIEHCEKNGWRWFISSEEKPKKERVKNYGVNFSWDKRTRVSTK